MKSADFPVVVMLLLCSLGACSDRNPNPTVLLLDTEHLSVISEQITYSNSWEGGSGIYHEGKFHFRLDGKEVKPERLAAALFPKDSRCHNPFYSVGDLRLLSDNSVLVLMHADNSYCQEGRNHLARITAENGQLRVVRLPIIGGDTGFENSYFYRPLANGNHAKVFDSHEERLAIQGHVDAMPVILETTMRGWEFPHIISVDLASLTQHDLGPGTIEGFVDNGSIVLIRNNSDRIVDGVSQFTAVRVGNGEVLDKIEYWLKCFRSNDETSSSNAESYFRNEEVERLAEKVAKKELSIENLPELILPRFTEDKLPENAILASNKAVADELLHENTRVEWDTEKKHLRVAISKNIRRIRSCNEGKPRH